MTWTPFAASMAWPTATGVGRRARMRGQLLTTCRQCTTGLAWCATNVKTTHQPYQTLSAAMAGRTVHPPERETPSRGQAELICLNWESEQRNPGELASLRLPCWGHPPPIGTALEEIQTEKAPPANLQHSITCFPAHLDQAATHYSWITQDVCQQCWTL